MQKSLYFLKRTPLFASVLDGVLLLLALSVAVYCVVQNQRLDAHIAAQAAKSQATQLSNPTVSVAPDLQSKLDAALAVQTALNMPWLPMLNTLEDIKRANPGVKLLSIEPNKNRAEIRIKGETTEFEHITHLIEALSKVPAFKEVTLLNQHIEQSINENQQSSGDSASVADSTADAGLNVYVFEISMGWRL